MHRNFLYYLLPSVVKGALGLFVMVPLTTYYLDPEDFGIAAAVCMITGLITPLSSTGVTWVLSAHYYKADDQSKRALVFSLLLFDFVLRTFWCLLFLLAVERALPWIIKSYTPQYLLYFRLSVIATWLAGVWPALSYTLVLQKRGKAHASLELTQNLAGAATTIVCLAGLGLGRITLFIAPIAVAAVGALAAAWYMRSDVVPVLSSKWIREIVKTGLPTMPLNSFDTLKMTIDRYFIQRWVNLGQLGIYSHSQQYQQVFAMGEKAFNRSFVPEVLRALAGNGDLSSVRVALRTWLGFLGVVGVAVALFAGEAIALLTHDKFTAAAPLVVLWFLLMLIHAFGSPYSQYLFLQKRTRFLVGSGVALGTVFVGIGAALIWHVGIMGAATSAVAANLAVHLCRRFYAVRLKCPTVADREFCWMLAAIVAAHAANVAFTPALWMKVIAYVVVAAAIAFQYRLLTGIRVCIQNVSVDGRSAPGEPPTASPLDSGNGPVEPAQNQVSQFSASDKALNQARAAGAFSST